MCWMRGLVGPVPRAVRLVMNHARSERVAVPWERRDISPVWREPFCALDGLEIERYAPPLERAHSNDTDSLRRTGKET